MKRTLHNSLHLLGFSLVFAGAGCAVSAETEGFDFESFDEAELRDSEAEIIGGTEVNVATRRTLGLVDVNGGGC